MTVKTMLIIVFFNQYMTIEELLYAKRYQNVFDQYLSEFASSEILE